MNQPLPEKSEANTYTIIQNTQNTFPFLEKKKIMGNHKSFFEISALIHLVKFGTSIL